MEDLFRFILTRPAQRIDTKKGVIPARPSPEFDKALKDAKSSGDPRSSMRRVATAYASSAGALRSLDDLKLGKPLQALAKALGGGADQTIGALNALIKQQFDATADEVAKGPAFLGDWSRLSDALITNAILARDAVVRSYDAATLLRALDLVDGVARADTDLEAVGGVAMAFGKTVLLPGYLFPIGQRSAGQATPAEPAGEEDPSRRRKELTAERDRLLSTYNLLTRITPADVAPPATIGTDEATPVLRRAQVSLPPIVGGLNVEETRVQPPTSSGVSMRFAASPLLLKANLVAALGDRERTVLEERRLDLTQVPLPTAVERLSVELGGVELELTSLEAKTHQRMLKIGSTYLEDKTTTIGPVVYGKPISIPATHGSVAPAGIGDLLVVKQNLKRYEARELAHVENVLLGESKERMHRRARTTEETITTEIETKKEEERDQQTTERFELKTESSQVQKEDTSLKIGLAISGKYGPVVEFKASTDFALNTSKEEATKVATAYSKDITTRATSRIFERRSEQRILKTIEVFEERNTHGFDNKTGTGNVVGQYQWLDKIYEAQVFNYGKRLLFDIMLPEPAAFLLHATTKQPKAGAALVKPLPFTLQPTDISEWNYPYYVKQYETVGVTPPPQPYITVAKAFEGVGKEHEGATKAAELPVTDGYQAIRGSVLAWFNGWSGNVVDVSLGTNMHRFNDNSGWNPTLSNETGSLQFSMKTWSAAEFAIGVEVSCQRTQRALDEWRLKTHAAILQAYQKQVRDYEEKLSALQVQAAQEIQGKNPLENEQLIRTELKKGATSVFTDQQYDLFGAISLSPEGYPQPNLSEAAIEGKYIRFFEQAFEWEQMMYFFYPYFWGRKPNWLARALLQDVDPLFGEFIKAGAARIVISVRPGFEKAIAHFFDTGEIWDGGDLPDISSPLYVSIIDEIRERDKAPGKEVAQGDPWDVHLPTTLVLLRSQAGLPAWQKNAAGDWVPV